MSTISNVSTTTGLGLQSAAPGYKRPFDLVVGLLVLVILAPAAVVVALVVRCSSPGPILFRQERLGQDGRRFTLYKFRTMYHGVDSRIHEEYFKRYQQGEPVAGQTCAVFKLWRDPRITPLGGLLRRLALDEIPQIVNVLKGDMSLVGPRPPLEYEVALYTERDLGRLTVKPGMTGLWQIKGRDVVDFATMVDLDLEYISRQSLVLDLAIVLYTVPALIWSHMTH